MKKFLVRAERAVVKALLSPAVRPLEHEIVKGVALRVLVRFGVSSALVALVVEMIDRYLS